MNVIILFLILTLFDILAEYFLQKGALSKHGFKDVNYIMGIFFIIVAFSIYFYILRAGHHIGVSHALHHGLSIAIIAILSSLFFENKFTYLEIFAIMCIILGITILSIGESHSLGKHKH